MYLCIYLPIMYVSIYVERERETGREKYLIAFKVQKTDQLTNNFTEGSIFLALFTSTPTNRKFLFSVVYKVSY